MGEEGGKLLLSVYWGKKNSHNGWELWLDIMFSFNFFISFDHILAHIHAMVLMFAPLCNHSICFIVVCSILPYMLLFMNSKLKCTPTQRPCKNKTAKHKGADWMIFP